MSECCICLAGEEEGDFFAMPGCGHRLHVTCGLRLAQEAPLRCPICRRQPLPPAPDDIQNLRSTFDEFARQRRVLQARRRRFLASHPDVQMRWNKLHEIRRRMDAEAREGEHMFHRKCREMYRTDPEIRELKKRLSNMRRRELRLVRFLQENMAEG